MAQSELTFHKRELNLTPVPFACAVSYRHLFVAPQRIITSVGPATSHIPDTAVLALQYPKGFVQESLFALAALISVDDVTKTEPVARLDLRFREDCYANSPIPYSDRLLCGLLGFDERRS